METITPAIDFTGELSDLFNLQGKVAFLPGGYGGIGEAIAWGLAIRGAKVVVSGRSRQKAEKLARQVRAVDQIANAVGIRAQCLFRSDQWDGVLETEKVWRELEHKYARERTGETCFFVALSSSVYGLRGDHDRAAAYAEESYNYMVSMSGEPDNWQRNQFY